MMNKNIDELIKSALEEHEMPYDNNAWNSFEKKLMSFGLGLCPNKLILEPKCVSSSCILITGYNSIQ